MPQDGDLEPVAERPILPDRDARPSSRPAVSGPAFAVPRQVAEGARAALHLVARETRTVASVMAMLDRKISFALPVLLPQRGGKRGTTYTVTAGRYLIVLARFASRSMCYHVWCSTATAGGFGLGGYSQGERN